MNTKLILIIAAAIVAILVIIFRPIIWIFIWAMKSKNNKDVMAEKVKIANDKFGNGFQVKTVSYYNQDKANAYITKLNSKEVK
jgi:nitrogen fixation-related uncharacterized protein